MFDWNMHVDGEKCEQCEWKPGVQGFRPKHSAQHLEKQCFSPRQQEMPAYLADGQNVQLWKRTYNTQSSQKILV